MIKTKNVIIQPRHVYWTQKFSVLDEKPLESEESPSTLAQ